MPHRVPREPQERHRMTPRTPQGGARQAQDRPMRVSRRAPGGHQDSPRRAPGEPPGQAQENQGEARLAGRQADKPDSRACMAGRPDRQAGSQARHAGKQTEISQTGRQPRQADSSQAADKQAKLRANKVRQAEGPRKLRGDQGRRESWGLSSWIYYIM